MGNAKENIRGESPRQHRRVRPNKKRTASGLRGRSPSKKSKKGGKLKMKGMKGEGVGDGGSGMPKRGRLGEPLLICGESELKGS